MASRARLAAAAKGDSRLARPDPFVPGPGLALAFALASLASLNFEEPREAPKPPLAMDSEYIFDGCPGRTIMAKDRSNDESCVGRPSAFQETLILCPAVSGRTFSRSPT